MTRVFVTHSYFYRLDSKQWHTHQPYPPLGTLQAAAVLRNEFDVQFFDTGLSEGPRAILPALERFQPKYVVIYDDGFNYLTKMCLTVMRDAALQMARECRERGATVILSSSDAADHYALYLENSVDFVIRGEGEVTLQELLRTLEQGSDVERVAGIAFRKKNETVVTPQRPVLRDLDTLPMPAWDLLDVKPYRKIWMKHQGYFSLNLATTRGCPFKCNWCAKPIYGNRYHSRSPERVVAEIEYLISRFQVDHFWMSDDIFGLKPGWVETFARLVQERKLSFRYKIQSRADLLTDEATLDGLARSGAETIWIGAESGSQKILDAMEKGTTVKQIADATRQLKARGMRVGYFLQFGYLGETQADINSTLKMVLTNLPDEIGISVSYPLPGTRFYDIVREQLKEKQNWTDSDDLAMMYRATYAPPYYKLLHRYVHSRYRIRRGWANLKNKKFELRPLASMIYHLPVSLFQSWKLSRLQHAK